MEIRDVIKLISELSDVENGGNHALNGFEFQVSSAIYLAFEQYKDNQDFALIYEKLEDFIIINDKINLFQAKGTNFSITPKQLIKNRSTKKDHQSIIEKMYDNYLQVKSNILGVEAETNLIVCENSNLSKLLWDSSEQYNLETKDLSFVAMGENCRNEILAGTRHQNYDWENMKVRKLFPKPRHEEITRIFIEDVITMKKGPNKINSKALYGALVYEINKIRKNKSFISGEFLEQYLAEFITTDSDTSFDDVNYLLDEVDRRSLKIRRSFEEFKLTYNIPNHSINNDFELISSLYNSTFNNINEFLQQLEQNPLCVSLLNRLNKVELVALSLLVICKKEGII